jgi:hypothetical protein
MFQLFLRARLPSFARARLGVEEFKARSPERDAEADRLRVGSIVAAIESALRSAESEQSGLSRRVEDVLARASVTIGNGTDEYLDRDVRDGHHQDLFDAEIMNGQRRLTELTSEIAHFKFMKAAVLTRFPDYKTPASSN